MDVEKKGRTSVSDSNAEMTRATDKLSIVSPTLRLQDEKRADRDQVAPMFLPPICLVFNFRFKVEK
ncbi:hypothetical protein HJC23_011242 [Cyclotella cryptica]|uniref:Uncharacterized protein n=1 Tax=Cyclotella cryptica TaxID=29204 RepID=A0ABD3QWH3_9STRA